MGLCSHFECPVSMAIFKDPVKIADGSRYEREDIMKWFEAGNNTNPRTNLPLDHLDLTSDHKCREALNFFREEKLLEGEPVPAPEPVRDPLAVQQPLAVEPLAAPDAAAAPVQ